MIDGWQRSVKVSGNAVWVVILSSDFPPNLQLLNNEINVQLHQSSYWQFLSVFLIWHGRTASFICRAESGIAADLNNELHWSTVDVSDQHSCFWPEEQKNNQTRCMSRNFTGAVIMPTYSLSKGWGKKRKRPLVPRFSSYANLPINMLLGTKALWKSERDTSVHKRKGCSLTYFIFSSLFIRPDLCASRKKVITKKCEIVLLDWTSADGVEWNGHTCGRCVP